MSKTDDWELSQPYQGQAHRSSVNYHLTCVMQCLTCSRVIRSFRNKGLRRFFETGDASKLPVTNHARMRRVLAALDVAARPEELNIPGFRFHGLQGTPKRYAVDASGNYRVTFAFAEGDVLDLDIEDYH